MGMIKWPSSIHERKRKNVLYAPDEFAPLIRFFEEYDKREANTMKNHNILELSEDQMLQVDLVENAARALIDALLSKPEYLEGTKLKGRENVGYYDYIIHPSELADLVADIIIDRAKRDGNDPVNIFFPLYIHEDDGSMRISDTYNEEPVYECE